MRSRARPDGVATSAATTRSVASAHLAVSRHGPAAARTGARCSAWRASGRNCHACSSDCSPRSLCDLALGGVASGIGERKTLGGENGPRSRRGPAEPLLPDEATWTMSEMPRFQASRCSASAQRWTSFACGLLSIRRLLLRAGRARGATTPDSRLAASRIAIISAARDRNGVCRVSSAGRPAVARESAAPVPGASERAPAHTRRGRPPFCPIAGRAPPVPSGQGGTQ